MSLGSLSVRLALFRRNPVIRLLSSIRCGVTLMVLVLAYASFASALPPIRGAIEMSEMEIFAHWIFALLVSLLCVSVIIATLTRIRWAWVNAGVLTVHTGILLLCGGSIWYFAAKIEGDVLLRTPRIQLLNTSGSDIRPIAELQAEKGKTWANRMPAFGGTVSLAVQSTRNGEGKTPVSEATINARVGRGEPQTLTLKAGQPAVKISERLSAQLLAFPEEEKFYNGQNAALYYRRKGESEYRQASLEDLPLYRERYDESDGVLQDSMGRPVPSKRYNPHIPLGIGNISTRWLEGWRLPVRLDVADAPFRAEAIGFVPYIDRLTESAASSGGAKNPAVNVSIKAGSERPFQETLIAFDPHRSVLRTGIPVELKWAKDADERERLLKPLAGAHELSIEVKDPPIKKVVAIQQGETVKLESAGYELTVQRFMPRWPLMSPGYESVETPAALVEVKGPEKSYTRTVIERFAHLSQDIDEEGVRHSEGPYDPNLVLLYRSSPAGRILLVGDDAQAQRDQVEIGVFNTAGKLDRLKAKVGESQHLETWIGHVDLTVTDLFTSARFTETPVITPLEIRRPNLALRAVSALQLRFSDRDAGDELAQTRWMLFSNYPHIEPRPITVDWDGEEWEFIYSRLEHPLGASLAAGALTVEFFPGRNRVESWRSDFFVREHGGEQHDQAAVFTNQTCRVGGWTLFQSGAAQDHWSFTILGVGNRNGIWPMLLGSTLIPLGCLYAFYVKPVLKQRAYRRAAAEAARGSRKKK